MADGIYLLNPRKRRARRRVARRGARVARRTRRKRAKSMTFTMRANPLMASMGNPRRRGYRRRRSYRRNPKLPLIGALPFDLMEVAGAAAGSIGVRMGTDLILKDRNRGPMGWLGNLGVTLGLAMLAKQFAPKMAKAVALGGAAFTAVRILGETMMKSAGVAGVVDYGTDYGYTPVTELGGGESSYSAPDVYVDLGEGDRAVDISQIGAEDMSRMWE